MFSKPIDPSEAVPQREMTDDERAAMEAVTDAETDRAYSDSVLHWQRRAAGLRLRAEAAERDLADARERKEIWHKRSVGNGNRAVAAEKHALELDARLTVALADLAQERATRERLRKAGQELAHWLQIWVDDTPGGPWCYSEAALTRWQKALASAPSPVVSCNCSATPNMVCDICQGITGLEKDVEAAPSPAVERGEGDVPDPPYIHRGITDYQGKRQRYVTCRDCGWLTYTESLSIVDHANDCPHNPRAAVPSTTAGQGEAASHA
jgi:hypothetical protein